MSSVSVPTTALDNALATGCVLEVFQSDMSLIANHLDPVTMTCIMQLPLSAELLNYLRISDGYSIGRPIPTGTTLHLKEVPLRHTSCVNTTNLATTLWQIQFDLGNKWLLDLAQLILPIYTAAVSHPNMPYASNIIGGLLYLAELIQVVTELRLFIRIVEVDPAA